MIIGSIQEKNHLLCHNKKGNVSKVRPRIRMVLQEYSPFRLLPLRLVWERSGYFKKFLSCSWGQESSHGHEIQWRVNVVIFGKLQKCKPGHLHLPMCFSLSLNRASSEMASMEAAQYCSPASRSSDTSSLCKHSLTHHRAAQMNRMMSVATNSLARLTVNASTHTDLYSEEFSVPGHIA